MHKHADHRPLLRADVMITAHVAAIRYGGAVRGSPDVSRPDSGVLQHLCDALTRGRLANDSRRRSPPDSFATTAPEIVYRALTSRCGGPLRPRTPGTGLHWIGPVPASVCPDLTALSPPRPAVVDKDRFGGLTGYD